MKKIPALLLAVSIMFTSWGASVVMAEGEADYSFYLDFAENLGIVEDVSDAALPVTRENLAIYINNIFSGTKSASITADDFFEESNENIIYSPSTDIGAFDDVLASNTGYEAIKRVQELGIMRGTGHRTFSPEGIVTFTQLATVMVRTLGYAYRVEDNNYVKVADAIGVFEDIAFSPAEEVSLGAFAKVLHNCLDINVVYIDMKGDHLIFREKEDVNIFNEFMDVYECEGMLEENPYTSVNGARTGEQGRVVINGEVFDSNAENDLYELIGRDVNVFYKKTGDDDIGTVLWGYANGKDEALTVSAEQIVSFVNGSLTYEADGKYKEKKIASAAVLIKNGIYQSSYRYTDEPNSDFDFDYGDLTVIRPRRSNDYSIIIVNDYKSMKVESVGSALGLINGRQYYNGAATNLSVSSDNYDEWRLSYVKADGTPASFTDIREGMVIDVLQNTEAPMKYMKIIVSDKIISDKITGITGATDEGVEYTFADGSSLVIPSSYYDRLVAGGAEPKLGGIYTFGINSFGKITYIEAGETADGTSFVYVLERRFDEFENIAVLRYLNTKGAIVTSEFKKNAVLVNHNGSQITLKSASEVKKYVVDPDAPQSWDEHDSYKGVAQLTFNKDGLITKMAMPVRDTTRSRKNVFGTMVNNFADGETTYFLDGPESGRKHFYNVMYDESTVGFKIDETQAEEADKYTLFSDYNSLGNHPYTIAAYNFDSDSFVADCIVMQSVVTDIFPYAKPLYIINDVYEGVYGEEVCTMCNMTSFGREITSAEATYPIKEGVLPTSFARRNADNITAKRGDIVYAEIVNGYIVDLKVIYRIFETDENKSHLFDTTGKMDGNSFESAEEPGKLTNPYNLSQYTLSLQAKSDNSKSLNCASGTLRFLAGDVYSMEDGKYLTYTTQRIKDGRDSYNPDDSAYISETLYLPTRFTVITVTGKKISIKQGTPADILTYRDAGEHCSEIFMCNQQGAMRRMAIINVID